MTQLSDEVVERVARALCLADGGVPDVCNLGPGRPMWRLYEKQARAAIAAYEAKGDIPVVEG